MRVNVTKRYRRAAEHDPGKINTYEPGEQDMPDADAIACIAGGFGERVQTKAVKADENKMEAQPLNKARNPKKPGPRRGKVKAR